ncbi:MAG: hypothetical protein CVU48_10625, partial [Candidatus Cloacimonetes bacterium HGW-Cloacimonetes-1]
SPGAGTPSTVQVWLHETSNIVKYVYGAMYNNSTSTMSRGVYISTSNVAGSVGNVTTINTTPTWNATSTSVTNTTFALNSAMLNLDSPVVGARRVFTFAPPVAGLPPNAALVSTPANAATQILPTATLNWTSGGGMPTGYRLYFGTDNPPTNIVNNLDMAMVTTYDPTPDMLMNTPYYWKVVAYNANGDAPSSVWSFTTHNGQVALTAPAAAATNQAIRNLSFSWGTAPSATGYVLQVGTAPGLSNIYNAPATSPTVVTGPLSYSTDYYWSVYSVYTEGNIQSVERVFTTMADPTITAFPYSVDFGTTGAVFPPTNWGKYSGALATPTVLGSAGTGSWYQDDWKNTVTTPPNYAAKMNIYGTTVNGWLITPPIAVPAGNYQVEFDLALMAWNSNGAPGTTGTDDVFAVLIGDGTSWTPANVVRQYDNAGSSYVYNNIPPAGTNVILPMGTAGTKYIAFYGISTVSNADNDLMIDNVLIRETPAAPIFGYSPTTLNMGEVAVGNSSAWRNVTVTNTGGGTLNLTAANVSIIGTNAAQFAFNAANLPAALASTQSVQIPVRYTASAEGAQTATLRINYSGTNYDVALSGSGLPAGMVVIGSGTLAMNSSPINPYYGYTYSQSIYLQSEINMPGQRIESISFYWNGLAEAISSNDWVIYMGHTAAASFASTTAWIPSSSLTQVYAGTVALPAVAGWITIPLSSPFAYNNVDNLVIAVDENTAGYDDSAEKFLGTGALTNRSIAYYSDTVNPTPAVPGTANGLVPSFPNVKMQFGDIPAGQPEHLTLVSPADNATGVNPANVNLSWAHSATGGVPTGYTVFVSDDAELIFDQNTFNIVTGPVSSFDLDAVFQMGWTERWYWAVVPYNVDGEPTEGTMQIFNFTTMADPSITLPHTQAFDALAIPGGWTQTASGGFTTNRWAISATALAGGTANEMKLTYTTGVGISRLITPPISTLGVTQIAVSFNQLYDDYGTGVTGKIQYSYDLATWFDTSYSIIGGGGNVTGNTSVLISGLNSPTTYLAWTLDGDHYQIDYWYVDDVMITEPLAHDVAAVSIDMMEVVNPVLMTPMATVLNNGLNTETFTVTMAIGIAGYTNTQTVTALASGASIQVSFAGFTPTVDTGYPVTVTTTLATDENAVNNVVNGALICVDLNVQAYGDVAYNPGGSVGPGTFMLSTPGTLTDLPAGVNPLRTNFMPGADWNPNYGWQGSNYVAAAGVTPFWSVNRTFGAMTSGGNTNFAYNGVAFDATTGTWYGVTSTQLYTFDPIAGTEALVGEFGAAWPGVMIGIAHDNTTGVLYGVDLGYDGLFTINKTDGVATAVGGLGIDLNYAQDCAIDQNTGYLYMAGYTTAGALYWIDTTTGGAYIVNEFQNGAEVTGFAIPWGEATSTSAPVVTIASDGALTWAAVTGATVYTIYGSTTPDGTFTQIGWTTATTWTDPNLAVNAAQFYQVKADNGRAVSNLTNARRNHRFNLNSKHTMTTNRKAVNAGKANYSK